MALTKVRNQMIEGATVNVLDFGAVGDGVTDDTAAIQAAIDYAETFTNGHVVLAPSAAYKCNSGLTLDTNRASITGYGATLDFSGATTGSMLTILQSENSGNLRNPLNGSHPITSIIFKGPGLATTAVRAILIEDTASPYTVSRVTIRDCAFIDFAKDARLSDGAFCTTFENCNFTTTAGAATTYSIEVPSGTTNAGERNMFINCMWNNRSKCIDHANPNGNMFLMGCSMDYGIEQLNVSGGSVYLIGCHLEGDNDTGYWFAVGGTNSLISMTDCEIVLQAGRTNFAIFSCDSSCTAGGVYLDNCRYAHASGAMTVPLIAGTGRSMVSNFRTLALGVVPNVLSFYQNQLAYGTFESANYTAEWTLVAGAIRSAVSARTGTYSLSLPASTGVTPEALVDVAGRVGQRAFGEYWYRITGITGTGGNFYVRQRWLDAAGNVLSETASTPVTTDVAEWTQVVLNHGIAPKGAVEYSVFFNVFGTTSGTPVVYIDDVVINMT
jgi:hypothetical protein